MSTEEFDLEIIQTDFEDDGEIIEKEKPIREGDYEIVSDTEEKEPDRGMLERLKYISGPQKVIKSTMGMVYNHVMDSNPVELCNPATLFGVFAQATFAASFQEIHGAPLELDYKQQILAARKHLEEGKGSWSDDQTSVVQSWLDEADTRLKAYLEQSTVTETKKESTSLQWIYDPETKRYNPPPTPVIPKITFRTLIEGSKTGAANPKMEMLEQKDPKLHSVLLALIEFLRIPYKIQSVERDEVQRNIDADPAMGSSTFIENLTSRAFTLAEGLKKPELKRILIAVSGPGTAKSTSCRLMFKWAKYPCCMLSGEVFRNMCAGRSSDDGHGAFAVFSEWVCQQILTARINNEGVTGIGLLLDDWHFAMEAGGPFSEKYAPSRRKFISFVKNCGDSSQKSILQIALATDRKFPLNFERIVLAMTFNRMDPDLYENADVAVRSRYENLEASYATEEDRLAIATKIYIPQIKQDIAAQMQLACDEIIFDEEFTLQEMTKVIDVDICIFRDKFKRQNGIRGLTSLMQKYKQARAFSTSQSRSEN
jgi:hypothetical protein